VEKSCPAGDSPSNFGTQIGAFNAPTRLACEEKPRYFNLLEMSIPRQWVNES